ncbi:MAG: peptidoglycan DD-metalloendopeptidase family protein [Clostridiales Family XIII bacterium]|nr:peptidoglycan DD-metalloendopeptidase family protein [Clostridiales Family XIII bacterium]
MRSLAADYAKKAWDALTTPIGKPHGKLDIRLEGMRLVLLGRYRASRIEKRTRIRVSSVGAAAIAIILVFSAVSSAQVFSVSVNGQVVGYVQDKADYAFLVNNAKEKISKENGNSEIFIQEADIELKPVIKPGVAVAASATATDADSEGSTTLAGSASQEPVSLATADVQAAEAQTPAETAEGAANAGSSGGAGGDIDAIENALIDTLIRGDAVKATVYNIEINGQPMATLATMKEASDVLQNIAAAYKTDLEDATAGFVDDVQIIGKTLDLDAVRTESAESVTEFLLTGINDVRTYTAKEKDKIKDIATALGITKDELRFAYPEYDFLLIRAGDVFEYTQNTPHLQYKTAGIEDADVTIPYETIEERTNSLYLGERETKIAGVDGLRHVKRDITRINGVIVSSAEISSETIRESSPATVLTGTLLVPGDAGLSGETGGGPLGRPLAAWSFSRGLGGAHMGDDLLAPQGTPILSAEHGVVTFTGGYGGYGNLVIISHGNGLETYYAHCDTINVAEGQIVERGQQIATVGITGRATAYHLHFEVRVGGVAQEPLDWIS